MVIHIEFFQPYPGQAVIRQPLWLAHQSRLIAANATLLPSIVFDKPLTILRSQALSRNLNIPDDGFLVVSKGQPDMREQIDTI